MMKYLILFFMLVFSHFSLASEQNQLVETCPPDKPILGYMECYSCTDPRSLNYHYPEHKASEWERVDEFYEYIHEHRRNSYRGDKQNCKDVCPNRIEYCGFAWLGEGDCFCEIDNFKNRIKAFFYSNILNFFFIGKGIFTLVVLTALVAWILRKARDDSSKNR